MFSLLETIFMINIGIPMMINQLIHFFFPEKLGHEMSEIEKYKRLGYKGPPDKIIDHSSN